MRKSRSKLIKTTETIDLALFDEMHKELLMEIARILLNHQVKTDPDALTKPGS